MTATFRLALGAGLLAAAGAAMAQALPAKTYIVRLADAPAATYDGSVAGLAATRPAPGAKLDVRSPAYRAYAAHLAVRRSAALAAVGNVPVLQTYDAVLAGFSARLTDAQAAALRSSTAVASVTESVKQRLDTISTPRFLGLNQPGGLWSVTDPAGRLAKGEDVIIGIVDSGVWPEDASFGDRVDALGNPLAYHQPGGTPAYSRPPSKWAGACVTGPGFTAAMCNNKLIGARFYDAGFVANEIPKSSFEYLSPRDGGGHGTHTASTAGGNAKAPAVVDGTPFGTMSGIAPRARIAAYKVCWEAANPDDTGCWPNDSVKAIDDAVKDGVDVINFSISGAQTSVTDPVEIAFLNAAAAGVFVAASAGNSGPANQVAHVSPWITTVAASTHDRFTVAQVTLGNGAVAGTGPSYQPTGVPSKPLVRSIDAGVVPYANLTQAEKTALERCLLPSDGGTANTALDPAKVAGKIVICYRGGNVLVNKAAFVQEAGAAALIIQNVPAIGGTPASSNTTLLQPYVIPTVHLTVDTYAAINDYVVAQGAAATASFSPAVPQANVVAPVMAGFSSRGPNKHNASILKPDISGPGVDIIAGYIDLTLTQQQHDGVAAGTFTPGANAQSLQGTSMSSPHVAGAAALLRQLRPTWSPAAIKSALMTSATGIKLASGAPDPDRWGYGAGHMNPNGAADPGLVYDAAAADYGRFMCGLGLTPPAGIGGCGTLGSIAPHNLNLASITAGSVPGTQTLTRRVTNVGASTATYTAAVNGMTGWNVTVSPASLTLAAGASASFSVTLQKTTATNNQWTFGNLVWSDGAHTVTSPLSARAVGLQTPALVTDARTSGTGTKVYSAVFAYTGPVTLSATGLVPATLTASTIVTGQRQCFDFTVPANAQLARFALFNGDTQGGATTDLDLEVFDGAGGSGSQVGSSGGSSSDELVSLANPAAGTYSACVTGFAAAGGRSYTLSSWIIGQPVGAQTLRAAGPSQVYAGTGATIGLGWSVPAGKRYLGTVRYFDPAGALMGTTLVSVDNR